jgi:hypothetical protein
MSACCIQAITPVRDLAQALGLIDDRNGASAEPVMHTLLEAAPPLLAHPFRRLLATELVHLLVPNAD